MYDVIDFAIENSEEIADYEITYYGRTRVSRNGESIGEIIFTMKNGDKEIFQIC